MARFGYIRARLGETLLQNKLLRQTARTPTRSCEQKLSPTLFVWPTAVPRQVKILWQSSNHGKAATEKRAKLRHNSPYIAAISGSRVARATGQAPEESQALAFSPKSFP